MTASSPSSWYNALTYCDPKLPMMFFAPWLLQNIIRHKAFFGCSGAKGEKLLYFVPRLFVLRLQIAVKYVFRISGEIFVFFCHSEDYKFYSDSDTWNWIHPIMNHIFAAKPANRAGAVNWGGVYSYIQVLPD